MLIRQATPKDYPHILNLHHLNTPENLTKEQQKSQGFIVSKMDEPQLDKINQDLGILVATDKNTIMGFVCLHRINHEPLPPIVHAMLDKLPEARFRGKPLEPSKVFLYGPVCLGIEYRGQGILRKLLVTVKQRMAAEFSIGLAFIDDANPHSLDAHVKGLGMEAILPFTFHGAGFQMVAFDCLDT